MSKRNNRKSTTMAKTTTKLFSSLNGDTTTTNGDGTNYDCDVLIFGAGPTGRAMASLLSNDDWKVTICDGNYDRPLVPNYGVWEDEWDAVCDRYATQHGVTIKGGKYDGTKAIDTKWITTDCFFGGSFDIPTEQRLKLDRPYCRIDKDALSDSFSTTAGNGNNINVIRENHNSIATSLNIYTPTNSIVHTEDGSIVTLPSGKVIKTKLIVDATGHESKLVLRDRRDDGESSPGYQIAYGAILKCKGKDYKYSGNKYYGPYDKDAMTLFDYRTDHLEGESLEKAQKEPTFMYVMPLDDDNVFFEETSLVARNPSMSFQECKDRLFKRLQHLGIEHDGIIQEEEYCYIPMGGALPSYDQRIIGIGGAAAMVHPSTGYHLCRMLMGISDMATVIKEELASSEDKKKNYDSIASKAYNSIWTPDAIRQRNFAVFGGEFLMSLDVEGLRGFFDGFFRLPLEQWGGFLAGWKGLPYNIEHESWYRRLWFGVNFVTKLPPQVALRMVGGILSYTFDTGTQTLLQSVTPFFGEPASYLIPENDSSTKAASLRYDGDWIVKEEAKRMIMDQQKQMQEQQASNNNNEKEEEYIPAAFVGGSSSSSNEE